jgi:hypothetical protein
MKKVKMEKAKPLNNFQESTIEEIHNILNTIKDGKTWKKAMKIIHEMTDKDNIC